MKEIVKKGLDKLKADIIKRHRAKGQVASGKTLRMFRTEADDNGGRLWGAEWAGTLERGRKGGKVPYEFKQDIIKWAKIKGISFANQKELEKFAWFVVKKIRKEGTKRYKTNEDIFTTAIKEFRKELLQTLTSNYIKEIKISIYGKTK